jgi:hypothetical protein
VVLPEGVSGPGARARKALLAGRQSRVRLHDVGPRLELEIVKVCCACACHSVCVCVGVVCVRGLRAWCGALNCRSLYLLAARAS